MAWTDISNVLPGDLPLERATGNISDGIIDSGMPPPVSSVVTGGSNFTYMFVYRLESLAVKGFDDGYRPNYVPDPIANNIDQPNPDGGGEWPTSRFLYPRGY